MRGRHEAWLGELPATGAGDGPARGTRPGGELQPDDRRGSAVAADVAGLPGEYLARAEDAADIDPGFSEAMLDGTIDDREGVERSARIISDESNRVLRLVQELLDLSRIESGQVSMQQEEVDLRELFGHVGEVFALRAEEAGVEMDVTVSGGARILGDFDRLEQVLNNLLDNALRYTPAGAPFALPAATCSRGRSR
ncbi:MAG: HAMP domain-containing histidine kinase [Dehalococcoidia bacterium]|nr:HAMP domain-containing histidine kinase [Dehalococcoidia bacterium]